METLMHIIASDSWNWWSALFGAVITGILVYSRKALTEFITGWGTTVINAALWLAQRFVSRSIRARLSMRRYCRNRLSEASTRSLHVPGRRDRDLDVDEVFVPLILEQSAAEDPVSSSNLPDTASRMIVVGDPGSGKSTLVKRLYRDACRKTARNPSNGKLPILVELRSLEPPTKFRGDDAAGEWLLGVLKARAAQVEAFETDHLFADWSTNAGLMVMLDGLDEVSSRLYPVIASALRGLSQRLAAMSPDNTIIVTMRIQFHQQVGGHLRQSYPKTLYVSPFSPNEIYLFLTKWPFNSSSKQESIKKIYAELADRPTLREMCQNPLVLAMYVQNSLESDAGDLPSTRTEFYEMVTTELLVKRRARQNINSRTSIALREQREALFGQLAFENMTDPSQPVNSMSWKRAIELAEKTWKCSAEQAESQFLGLAKETGIIDEEKPGETLRFIHQTFCEFLAATECAKRRPDGWQDLMRAHRSFARPGESGLRTRLLEVVPFAHALLPQHARAAALADVAEFDDGLILGRCFLETQLYGNPEWEDYVEGERQFLSRQSSGSWDESMLRRLHLLSAVTRDSHDWAIETGTTFAAADLRDVVSSIASSSKELVATVFGTYARQDAAAALRLADEMGIDLLADHPRVAIEACQEAPFRDLMLDRMGSDDSGRASLILLEAALRYQSVAVALDALDAPASRKYTTNGSPMNSLVRACVTRPGSAYAAISDAAPPLPDAGINDFPAIRIFARCPTRTRYFKLVNTALTSLHLAYIVTLFSGYIILAVCTNGITAASLPTSPYAMFLASIFTLIALAEFSMLAAFSYPRKLLYEIGNLQPNSSEESSTEPSFPITRLLVRLMYQPEINILIGFAELRPNDASISLKKLKIPDSRTSLPNHDSQKSAPDQRIH